MKRRPLRKARPGKLAGVGYDENGNVHSHYAEWHLVRRTEGLALALAAACRDPIARMLTAAIEEWMRKVPRAECLRCGRRITRTNVEAFSITTVGTKTLVAGFCASCTDGNTRDAMTDVALKAISVDFAVDIRVIDNANVSPVAGRA